MMVVVVVAVAVAVGSSSSIVVLRIYSMKPSEYTKYSKLSKIILHYLSSLFSKSLSSVM